MFDHRKIRLGTPSLLLAEDWWGYGQDTDRMNFTFNPEKKLKNSSPKD